VSALRVTDAAGVEHQVIVEGDHGPRIDDAATRSELPVTWHELVTMGDALAVVVHQGAAKRVYPVGPKIRGAVTRPPLADAFAAAVAMRQRVKELVAAGVPEVDAERQVLRGEKVVA
jgi:hypothetical protein